MIETEKRYHVNLEDVPQDDIKSKININQTYSHFDPDVRIRKINDGEKDTYFHTVKYFLKNNQREEIEQPITEDQYNRIFSSIDKKPVNKDRYFVDLDNGLTAEVDNFLDTGDMVVEVEFPDKESMDSFVKPDWFGDEIKEKQSFSVQVFSKINSNRNDIYEDIRNKYRK